MKAILCNVNQSVSIADGERKGDCERREGVAKTRKRCAFKDSVPYMPGLTTVSEKKAKQDHVVLVGTLPSPYRGLTWFNKDPPPP